MKLNDKTIIYVLVICLLILFAFYIGRDCGCPENYRGGEDTYIDSTTINDKWYDQHNCNAMHNNWMHNCQSWDDLFYEKTPQCSKFKNDMKRGDPSIIYFY